MHVSALGLSCENRRSWGGGSWGGGVLCFVGLHTTARELQMSTFEFPGASKHHQNSTANWEVSEGGIPLRELVARAFALWRSWTCKIRSYNTLCFSVVARS